MTNVVRLPTGSVPHARRILVTGCAGFIGSHLCERLVGAGHDVVGVDCFTDFYARELKRRNLDALLDDRRFAFIELDLSTDPMLGLVDDVDIVIHLAAQAGVRDSFGEGFETYVRHNIRATQRLLEAATSAALQRFVYASSSSVYGDAEAYPTQESIEPRPVSPYGMTKVATEELAGVYHRCYGVPVVGLRYFTAYGPRQRPDMAFCRFLRRAISGDPLPVIGDGRQIRDFTFVGDVVTATIAAARLGCPGSVYNIGGGSPVELREAITVIERLVGHRLQRERRPAQVGEARCTCCDGSRARFELDFVPTTGLEQGLAAQLEWMLVERPSRPVLGARGGRAG
jgi:nucleoside-diphosphate-sugar epimerase